MKNSYFKFENYPQRDFPVYSSVRKNIKSLFGFHYHKDAEIIKVISGTVQIYTGTKQYTLKENDIIFFSPFSIHAAEAETDIVETHALTFDPSILKDEVDYSYTRDTHCIFRTNHPQNLEINKVFDDIFSAYWNKPSAYKLRITAGLMLLSGLLIECNFIPADNNVLLKFRTLPAIEYIKENYNKEIRIDELSSMLNFCSDHFIRIFKAENKKTPFEYIIDYRIEEALKLLLDNKYSVSEIANMTGFSSSSHFIKVFKQKLNTTPGKYQKTIDRK